MKCIDCGNCKKTRKASEDENFYKCEVDGNGFYMNVLITEELPEDCEDYKDK